MLYPFILDMILRKIYDKGKTIIFFAEYHNRFGIKIEIFGKI
jgi:hypothetical protein